MQGSRILEWAEELSDRFARAVGESAILRWLCTRARRIGSAFGRGCFFRLFDGDRFLGRVSARCARKGLAERFCLGVGKRLLLTSASSFAVFFAFYGAVSAVLLSVGEGMSISFGSVLSLSLLLASLPLLHLETPMGVLLIFFLSNHIVQSTKRQEFFDHFLLRKKVCFRIVFLNIHSEQWK